MTEEEHTPADVPSPGASQIRSGIENDYYSKEVHGPFEHFSMEAFELEEGETLRNCEIAYTTFGELNDAKDNAVLFPHMYSGTSKDMEMYVGADSAIDPNEFRHPPKSDRQRALDVTAQHAATHRSGRLPEGANQRRRSCPAPSRH